MRKPGKSLKETTAAFQLSVQPGPEEERGGEGEETWGRESEHLQRVGEL